MTAMVLVALLAWTALLRGWVPMPMPGPELGPMSRPGVPEAIGTGNGLLGVGAYLLMWGVMMTGMMYPAMVPFVSRFETALDGDRPARAVTVSGFLAGYSLLWTATGAVPLVADLLVDLPALARTHGTLLLGGSLLAASVYQLSASKRETLADCCATVDPDGPGLLAGLRQGVEHGLQCVRCTWLLMALMVVVGSMNLFWMLLLTFAITAERLAPGPEEVATTLGVLAGVGGLAALLLNIPLVG
jgi:predicted metal-binding membrane protein